MITRGTPGDHELEQFIMDTSDPTKRIPDQSYYAAGKAQPDVEFWRDWAPVIGSREARALSVHEWFRKHPSYSGFCLSSEDEQLPAHVKYVGQVSTAINLAQLTWF